MRKIVILSTLFATLNALQNTSDKEPHLESELTKRLIRSAGAISPTSRSIGLTQKERRRALEFLLDIPLTLRQASPSRRSPHRLRSNT